MANEKKSILSRSGKATLWLFGLLVAYILIGSIDGPLPKDDDLYLPPPTNIPDEQNASVALMEIFGSDDKANDRNEDMASSLAQSNLVSMACFGPDSPILQAYLDNDTDYNSSVISVKDKEGRVIMTVSNRVDFTALVDAVLATNEYIATTLARAAERPLYVNYPRSHEYFPLGLNWNRCYCYRQARHKRFLEMKRYDEAIEAASILLELSNKVLNGYCDLGSKLMTLWHIHHEAIGGLAEIASLKDADENTLAKIDSLLIKYDLKDWKAIVRKMIHEDYSQSKSFLLHYSSLSLADKCKEMNGHIPLLLLPLLNFYFHPNRTLSLRSESYRRILARLDDSDYDYDLLFTKNNKRHKRGTIERFSMRVFLPNALGESCSPAQSLFELHLKHTANVFRKCRSIQLMVASRRHFLKTNKLPETVASISPGILPNPILDPVVNIPYEIKSWRDGDVMHVAAFTKGSPEEAVACKNGLISSPADRSIAHMAWPVK